MSEKYHCEEIDKPCLGAQRVIDKLQDEVDELRKAYSFQRQLLESTKAELQAELDAAMKEIGDLRAAAVRKGLMQDKGFTGKCNY